VEHKYCVIDEHPNAWRVRQRTHIHLYYQFDLSMMKKLEENEERKILHHLKRWGI